MPSFSKMHTDEMKVSVPPGVSGDWSVANFEVSQQDEQFGLLRALINGHHRYVSAGTYTWLKHHGATVMSDTPDECRDHMWPIKAAEGHCLVNGLGLGVVLQGMLRKSEVTFVTVIEKSEDVIKLVKPHYMKRFSGRFEVIHADALEWKPPRGIQYGCVWHDIWDGFCTDNLKEMTMLTRRFARRTKYQGCWGKIETLRHRRREGAYAR